MEKSRTGLTCPVRQLFHTILAFYIGILMILKMRRNQGSRIHAVISKKDSYYSCINTDGRLQPLSAHRR